MKTAADEHSGGDAGQQGWIRRQRQCVTATDDMWDDRDVEMGCKDGDGLGKYQQGTTANLSAYPCSNNLGVGATTDIHSNLGCIWRLCVSYYNLNKITHWFKYPSWRFDNVIIHPANAKYRITKGESQLFCETTSATFEFTYQE